MSSSRIRKISTSKLDNLFEREGWFQPAPSSSSHSSSASIYNRHSRSLVSEFPTMNSLEAIRPPTIILPQNTSLLASSTTSLSSSAQTDDEYGYYDDCHADGDRLPGSYDEGGLLEGPASALSRKCSSKSTNNSSFTTSSKLPSATSTPVSITKLRDYPSSSFIKRSASNVVCSFDDHQADLACRSFESGIHTSHREKVTVCLSLAGSRISQFEFIEFAEYKVRVMIDSQEFIAWKSYDDFKALGEACRIHMNDQTSSRLRKGGSAGGRRHCSLVNTVNAWNEVVAHRPWFSKPTTRPFVAEEAKLLEDFMRELLFEIPSIDMLVAFLVD